MTIHVYQPMQAAVGGGLPIITTLQDMISTGDPVYSIKGTLSGTLSHLFNTFGPGQSFAQLVKDARAQGFTEPDPREDLCGTSSAALLMLLTDTRGKVNPCNQLTAAFHKTFAPDKPTICLPWMSA